MKLSIAVVITLLTLVVGGVWQGSQRVNAMDRERNQNTSWRLQGLYNNTLDRIQRMKEKCGQSGYICGSFEKRLMRDWKHTIDVTGKKLGYPPIKEGN